MFDRFVFVKMITINNKPFFEDQYGYRYKPSDLSLSSIDELVPKHIRDIRDRDWNGYIIARREC